jgi:hypothetical protein
LSAVSCLAACVFLGRPFEPEAEKEWPENLTSDKSKDDWFLIVRFGSVLSSLASGS